MEHIDYLRAGCPPGLSYRLVSRDPHTQAQAQAEWELLQALRTEALVKSGEVVTAPLQWLLERLYPERYDRKVAEMIACEMDRLCHNLSKVVGAEALAKALEEMDQDG
jgi:hypothetical protein